jgi:hypothetical protein
VIGELRDLVSHLFLLLFSRSLALISLKTVYKWPAYGGWRQDDGFPSFGFPLLPSSLSPLTAFPAVITENKIKKVNNINVLRNQPLHFACICNRHICFVMKSMGCANLFRLFENRLKFSSFPMIEETLFWEGEAVSDWSFAPV